MSIFREKMLNNISALAKKMQPFFYGAYFPAYVAMITALFYFLDLAIVGLFVYAVFACLTLVLYEDLTPFIPLPVCVLAMFKSFDAFSNVLTYVPLVFIFIALVLHFVLYPIKRITKGKLYLPLIIVTFALFVGGFFAPYMSRYGGAIVSMVAVGPLVLFIYFLFTTYVKPPEKFDFAKHVAYVLTLFGVLCAIETFYYKYCRVTNHPIVSDLNIGWSNINAVATCFLICMPACCYLLVRTGCVKSCLTALLAMYVAMYFTNSEACLGISVVFLPIFAIFMLLKSNDRIRKQLIIISFIVIILGLIAFAFILTKTSIITLATKLFTELMDDTSRSKMYRMGLELFSKYPIFGVGLHFVPEEYWITVDAVFAFNFHSSFFHILATMGIVGIVAFTFYYVRRYQILTQNYSAYNTFAFLSFTIMEIYAMIDTCEFNVMPIMLIVTILLVSVEKLNNKSNEQPLPLFKRRIKFN